MSKILNTSDIQKAMTARFFQGLDREQASVFLEQAVVAEEEKGKLLFSQGEPADRFYILLSGRVKLFSMNEEGDESIVEIFDKITSFAEAAMFASALFPVNCETLAPSRLIILDKTSFVQTMTKHPEISKALLKKLALSHRKLMGEIIQLKSQSPTQRLAAFFLSLVDEHSDGACVDLPYGKNLIAARVGMKPESLSRALVRLREIGVECEKNELSVFDKERLRQFVAQGL